VTASTGRLTGGPAAPASAPAPARWQAPADPLSTPPRLADGVELLGEYQNSAYSEPPSLVRRRDGQVIQMSALLYRVTSRIDGARDEAAIAAEVSRDLGRSLGADQVRYLVRTRLLPLGIIAADTAPAPSTTPAALPKASPLLALRARTTLLPARGANLVGVLLRPLFRPPVVAAVAGCVIAVDCWLLASHGVSRGIQQTLRDPADLLLIVALTVASAAFHECGHAAACRYGGGRPGAIGFGIYLVWPSFFTNVTDSYRLSRAGRLRTDLGGLYFNLIFILALAGVYAATSAQVLLLAIAVTHLEMLEQLLPFVRFDGYFVLSDLTGVPDLFARVGPILRSVLPSGRTDPRVAGMRRRSRIAVTSWVLCVVPLLIVSMGYLMLFLPQVSRVLWRSCVLQARLTSTAIAGHDYPVAGIDALGVALLGLSMAGLLYVVFGLARRLASLGLRWSAGCRPRLLVVATAVLATLTALPLFWSLHGEFRGW
jgi:putative peptide zinc metalloprotease protein